MGYRKTILGMVVGLVVLFSTFVGFKSASAQTNFSDLSSKDWGYQEISYLVDKGILKGYSDGTFLPNQALTREQAATIVGRSLDLNGTKRKTSFPDVKASSYASGYIQSLYQKGYITGYSDGTFHPKQEMKRSEMAYLISRAYSLGKMGEFLPYTDVVQSNANYKPINILTTANITNGYRQGTFLPDKIISRREFSLMAARALNSSFRPVTSQSVVSTGFVTASTLNIRQGPSVNYHVINKLSQQDPVKITKKVGGWGFVTSGDKKGYVSLKYINQNSQSSLTNRIITIDPGHGGKDSGACYNVNGNCAVAEKNIVLDVGKIVAQDLKQYGAKVVLTRNDDTFVTLQGRVDMSEAAGAQTFVSLHANTFSDSTASGTQTHYHIYSSAVNEQTLKSEKLASFIENRLLQMANMSPHGSGVKTDGSPQGVGFHVLRENNVPSTLVELGFISNAGDRKKLTSTSWQNTAAKAITLGIQDYFNWLDKQ